MLQNVKIQRMTANNIDEILVVENLCFKIPWSRQSFIDELNNKIAVYFISKIADKTIGYGGMWKILDEGHITNIAVHPDYRKEGVGGLILENIIIESKKNGITKLTLEVRKGNLNAQGLYKKYGFYEFGNRKQYYRDNNEDAIIMWKIF